MRDYALTLAQTNHSPALLPLLHRCLKNYRRRKQLAQYLGWENAALNDVGLSKAMIRKLLGLPLSVDFGLELERLQLLVALENGFARQPNTFSLQLGSSDHPDIRPRHGIRRAAIA